MAKIERVEITDQEIGAIYDSGKKNTVNFILTLVDQINTLTAMVEKQQEEIDELKAIIKKDSHNSNKPPSSDNPYKKTTKSLRKKGGKAGGQKGHPGSTLKMIEKPDTIEYHSVTGSCPCGHALGNEKPYEYESRQVFDIPPISVSVTEHRGERKECPVCGRIHTATFPALVTHKAQYGPRLKAYATYLKHYGFVSYERNAELFKAIFNVPLSQGTLVNMTNSCAKKLHGVVDRIIEKLLSSEVVHFDESGSRILGNLHWLHVASTKYLTYYYPHAKRGRQAMDAMGILPDFRGTAVHDHWKSYFNYLCVHSLCNVHHLRELTFLDEEHGQKWAGKMIKFLIDLKTEKNCARTISKKRWQYYERRYDRILQEGFRANPESLVKTGKRGHPKQTKSYNLLKRLKTHKKETLMFAYNYSVPFDNNLAERDIRMMKVQQKISGTFRSMQGAVSFCSIRSYISTIRKNGQDVINALESVFSGNIILPEIFLES